MDSTGENEPQPGFYIRSKSDSHLRGDCHFLTPIFPEIATLAMLTRNPAVLRRDNDTPDAGTISKHDENTLYFHGRHRTRAG